MRNLLALFALALLAFAGVGWYLDWYHVRSSPAAEGHQSVNIDINGTKIVTDVKEGIQKLEEKKQQLRDSGGKEETTGLGVSRNASAPAEAVPNE
jgi:hypothetical protein